MSGLIQRLYDCTKAVQAGGHGDPAWSLATVLKEIDAAGGLEVLIRKLTLSAHLHEALRIMVSVSNEAHTHWDEDRDGKVGKFLAAMSGHLKGYRADLTKVHDLLARIDKEEAEPASKQPDKFDHLSDDDYEELRKAGVVYHERNSPEE
jgi:hypothetical protein